MRRGVVCRFSAVPPESSLNRKLRLVARAGLAQWFRRIVTGETLAWYGASCGISAAMFHPMPVKLRAENYAVIDHSRVVRAGAEPVDWRNV
jgi:hypothetical protein